MSRFCLGLLVTHVVVLLYWRFVPRVSHNSLAESPRNRIAKAWKTKLPDFIRIMWFVAGTFLYVQGKFAEHLMHSMQTTQTHTTHTRFQDSPPLLTSAARECKTHTYTHETQRREMGQTLKLAKRGCPSPLLLQKRVKRLLLSPHLPTFSPLSPNAPSLTHHAPVQPRSSPFSVRL